MSTKRETNRRGRNSGRRDYFVTVQWPLLSAGLDVKGWPSPDEIKRIEQGWRNDEPAAAVSEEIIRERRNRRPFAEAA